MSQHFLLVIRLPDALTMASAHALSDLRSAVSKSSATNLFIFKRLIFKVTRHKKSARLTQDSAVRKACTRIWARSVQSKKLHRIFPSRTSNVPLDRLYYKVWQECGLKDPMPCP